MSCCGVSGTKRYVIARISDGMQVPETEVYSTREGAEEALSLADLRLQEVCFVRVTFETALHGANTGGTGIRVLPLDEDGRPL